MSITPPSSLGGTIENNQTWQGTDYAYLPSLQTGTKYYYRGNNTALNNTENIYWDTSDNTWNDDGTGNPFAFRVGTAGSELPAESALPTSGTNIKSPAVSDGDSVLVYRANSPGAPTICFSFTQPSGLYSSSGSGGIGTLSGGTSPEIKDVSFSKVTDSIVYLSFNWQNLNTATLFVDSGGTVTQTNIALGGAGQSGTVAGSGYLTGLIEGDKCWIANTPEVYIHKVIEWSYDKSTKKVVAKAFFQDNGGNGFSQNADVALVRMIGSTYGVVTLTDAAADSSNGFANHDGNLKTLTLDAKPGSRWAVSNIDTSQYGTSFKVPSGSSFSNFW